MKSLLTRQATVIIMFLFFALGAGGWIAQKYFRIRKNYSFDLQQNVLKQDDNLRRLQNSCQRGQGMFCLDSVAASTAWNSKFGDDEFAMIRKSCRAGHHRACFFESALKAGQQSAKRVWTQRPEVAEPLSGSLENWPRILFLDGQISYKQWLEFSYQSLWLSNEERKFDLLCGDSREFSRALVCISYGNVSLNLGLGRIAFLIEQSKTAPDRLAHGKSPLLRFWQGYDILRSDFDSAVALLQSTGDLNPEERALWDFLAKKSWEFVLVFNTFSVFSGIPSHEFIHGVYFHSEEYRRLISETFRQNVLRFLPLRFFVESLYKTKNEFVLLNEMQAYALQSERLFLEREDWNVAVGALRESVLPFLSKEANIRDFLAE